MQWLSVNSLHKRGKISQGSKRDLKERQIPKTDSQENKMATPRELRIMNHWVVGEFPSVQRQVNLFSALNEGTFSSLLKTSVWHFSCTNYIVLKIEVERNIEFLIRALSFPFLQANRNKLNCSMAASKGKVCYPWCAIFSLASFVFLRRRTCVFLMQREWTNAWNTTPYFSFSIMWAALCYGPNIQSSRDPSPLCYNSWACNVVTEHAEC